MEKIGILGSGSVGKAIADGFLKLGNNVMIGTRDKNKLTDWLKNAGKNAYTGSFAETAKFGELLMLCCKGEAVEDVINLAGKDNFSGKIVIDVTNPLLFEEKGPKLSIGYPDSLGAQIQKMLPKGRIVKAFNTVTATYMCNPKIKDESLILFVAGNDAVAKKKVNEIAANWGWVVEDIGDIEQSYLLEAFAMLWIRYGFLNNKWTHAFKLLK